MKLSDKASLKFFLDKMVDEHNHPSFIKTDPICIPHSFSNKQDIEIAGFFASIFSWGNRTTIINKSRELMQLMDNAPHEFILYHKESDLKKLPGFKHRTFNTTDLLYFVEFLTHHYSNNKSLESAFFNAETIDQPGNNIENGLNYFYNYFFSLENSPARTAKHIASPQKKSTCKRLNMFLRWMVRKDINGVDFGIWKKISPAELICPIDVHVGRVARRLHLLQRKQTDWQAALELTANLRKLDADDPVKYDFALFSIGVLEAIGKKMAMEYNPDQIREGLERSLQISLTGDVQAALSSYINDLIQNNFQKLVTILYRVDIDEEKLKQILKTDISNDTSSIIAKLIIERQVKKIETRKSS